MHLGKTGPMPTSSVPIDVDLPGATVAAMRRVIEQPRSDRPRVGHGFSARCDADGTFWAGALDGRARGAVRVSVRGTASDVDGGVRVRGVYGNDPRRAGLGIRVLAGFLAVAVLLTQAADLVRGRDVGF